MELKEICELNQGVHYETVNDTNFVIRPLFNHVALLVEPTSCGGYEDRYCISNEELAKLTIEEFRLTGKIKYWQKHHNLGITISCGNLAFNEGELQAKGREIFTVDWDREKLNAQYPYSNHILEAFLST
jgi:hypothetical protein